MARRKPFRKCVLKEMNDGLTKKEATSKCQKTFKKIQKKKK